MNPVQQQLLREWLTVSLTKPALAEALVCGMLLPKEEMVERAYRLLVSMDAKSRMAWCEAAQAIQDRRDRDRAGYPLARGPRAPLAEAQGALAGTARHGCYNRQCAPTLRVQDGWTRDGRRLMRTIPHVLTTACRYDLRATDPQCEGCSHQRTVVVTP